MISEEKLKAYEELTNRMYMFKLKDMILELITEIRELKDQLNARCATCMIRSDKVSQLEKEADWLADIADYYCGQDYKFCMRRCPLKSKDFRTGDVWCSTETSPELWREAARRAVEQ